MLRRQVTRFKLHNGRTVTYDMVTGQELSSTAWKANKATYDAVVTEVLEGYYADKASVSSKKVIQENLEENNNLQTARKLTTQIRRFELSRSCIL